MISHVMSLVGNELECAERFSIHSLTAMKMQPKNANKQVHQFKCLLQETYTLSHSAIMIHSGDIPLYHRPFDDMKFPYRTRSLALSLAQWSL